MRNRVFGSMLLVVVACSVLAGMRPAMAIDPYTAASIGSALLPRRTIKEDPIAGTSTVRWYVNGVLRGYSRESAGLAHDIPQIGHIEVMPYIPIEGGKGIRQAWWTFDDRATLRLDKPDSKRVRERERKEERKPVDEREPVPQYADMLHDGRNWYAHLEVEEMEVGPYTLRSAVSVEGAKEGTSRLIVGKFGSYKAKEGEFPVEINVIGITDDEGYLLPEFVDESNPDGINYPAIYKRFPNLKSPRIYPSVPAIQPGPQVFQQGILPGEQRVQDSDVSEDTDRATEKVRSNGKENGTPVPSNGNGSVNGQQPEQGNGQTSELTQTDKPANSGLVEPGPTGSKQWVKVINKTGTPVVFSLKWPNGSVLKPQVLQAGQEMELEAPQGLDPNSAFQVFFRPESEKKFIPLARADGTYNYPMPPVGSGRFVNITKAPGNGG